MARNTRESERSVIEPDCSHTLAFAPLPITPAGCIGTILGNVLKCDSDGLDVNDTHPSVLHTNKSSLRTYISSQRIIERMRQLVP